MNAFKDALVELYLELFNGNYSLALRQAMADIAAWRRSRTGYLPYVAELLDAVHFAP